MKFTNISSLPASCGLAGARRLVGWACLASGGLLLAPARAQANCSIPEPSIIWSSPAEGAVDVALDAHLLLVTESIYLPEATLTLLDESGERELLPSSDLPGHVELGVLEPDRQYTVRLESMLPVAPRQPTPLELHFTTGQRRAASAEGDLLLRSMSVIEAGTLSPEFCDRALWADTCYDTGVPSRYAFDLDAVSSPVEPDSLWVIEQRRVGGSLDGTVSSTTWPAACGVPIAFGYSPGGMQYRLFNIGTNGVVRASNPVVGEPAPAPQRPPVETYDRRDLGCSLSSGTPSPPWRTGLSFSSALALALLLRRARAAASPIR